MFVLEILGRKCTLAASRAAPWWVTTSVCRRPMKGRKNGTDRQTDGRQAITLRLPLHAPAKLHTIISDCKAMVKIRIFYTHECFAPFWEQLYLLNFVATKWLKSCTTCSSVFHEYDRQMNRQSNNWQNFTRKKYITFIPLGTILTHA